jgi:uncharacterized membrane protein YesL
MEVFMGGIFNIDGPFYRFGSTVWDIMALSLLWALFSVPVFTLGASTTALYYITTRRVSKKEGYLTADFWSSFKANFKQSTLVWLGIMLIGLLLIWNLYILLYRTADLNMPETMLFIILPMQVLLLIELILFSLYVFAIISRFDIHGKLLFKTVMLMAHKHLPTTVLLLAMFAIIIYAIFFVSFNPMLLIFSPGIYAYSASFFFMRIFKKYRPEMDKDTDELKPLNI